MGPARTRVPARISLETSAVSPVFSPDRNSIQRWESTMTAPPFPAILVLQLPRLQGIRFDRKVDRYRTGEQVLDSPLSQSFLESPADGPALGLCAAGRHGL